jgi:hypothetical protein
MPSRVRRHRRDAGVLASAVAVALVIAGVSVASRWRSRSADTWPAQAGISAATAGVTLEPCRASDLHVTAEFVGGATNNVSQPFVLTNTGNAGCVLQGYPSRLQGWQDGRWLQLTFTRGTFFIQEDATPSPVELAPGAQAELIIGTEDACNGGDIGNSKLYSQLRVTLPDQTSIELNEPVNAFCELDVSSFHSLPIPESSPTAVASTARTSTCRTSALRLSFISVAGAAGHLAGGFRFTNTATDPCSLDGYPTVTLRAANGTLMPTVSSQGGGYTIGTQQPARLVTLEPGGSTEFTVEWIDNPIDGQVSCSAAATITVTPPSGSVGITVTARVAPGISIAPCGQPPGLWLSPVGLHLEE